MPMSIKERVAADMKAAMKSRDRKTLEALRLVRAEFLLKEKEGRQDADKDATLIPVLQKIVKQRRESIEAFKQAARPELVEKEEYQLEVVMRYLPPEIGEEKIREVLKAIVERLGASSPSDIGKVMGKAIEELRSSGGMVDGKTVNRIGMEILKAHEREEE